MVSPGRRLAAHVFEAVECLSQHAVDKGEDCRVRVDRERVITSAAAEKAGERAIRRTASRMSCSSDMAGIIPDRNASGASGVTHKRRGLLREVPCQQDALSRSKNLLALLDLHDAEHGE